MHLAQWGLADRLAADPGVWLCHQCNDCTTRCPRDAKPGDVMQVIRSLAVEHLATPRFMGTLVGKSKATWPLLIGIPLVFWVVVLNAVNGLTPPEHLHGYEDFVPHWLIYAVFFTTTGFVGLMAMISAMRFWKLLGANAPRSGSFVSSLIAVFMDIMVHKRFGDCDTGSSRKVGHFALFWGFVGAAVCSGLIVVAIYLMNETLPLPQAHPFKILGNIAAVLLVFGGISLLLNRLQEDNRAGASSAYDVFFLLVVLLVVITGVLTEVGRYVFEPAVACWIYILHLAAVLCLFATFPYSKFAHMLYRTLAMVHERMASPQKDN
jgi:quinone-modifying oxidoreductase subunit QmoC